MQNGRHRARAVVRTAEARVVATAPRVRVVVGVDTARGRHEHPDDASAGSGRIRGSYGSAGSRGGMRHDLWPARVRRGAGHLPGPRLGGGWAVARARSLSRASRAARRLGCRPVRDGAGLGGDRRGSGSLSRHDLIGGDRRGRCRGRRSAGGRGCGGRRRARGADLHAGVEERDPSGEVDLARDAEAMAHLEGAHGLASLRPKDAVGRDVQLALDRGDGPALAAVVREHRHAAGRVVGRRVAVRSRRARAVRGVGIRRGGDTRQGRGSDDGGAQGKRGALAARRVAASDLRVLAALLRATQRRLPQNV